MTDTTPTPDFTENPFEMLQAQVEAITDECEIWKDRFEAEMNKAAGLELAVRQLNRQVGRLRMELATIKTVNNQKEQANGHDQGADNGGTPHDAARAQPSQPEPIAGGAYLGPEGDPGADRGSGTGREGDAGSGADLSGGPDGADLDAGDRSPGPDAVDQP